MSDIIRQLIEEHYSYYEVLPYYVVVEEGHGLPHATARRIQAGFDVDIYGTRIENDPPWQSHKYQLGYAELEKLAEETSHHPSDSCSIEVIPSYSNIFFDTQNDSAPSYDTDQGFPSSRSQSTRRSGGRTRLGADREATPGHGNPIRKPRFT